MKKIIFLILTCLIIAGSVVIVKSFFAPWANVSTSAVGIAKEVSGFAAKLPFAAAIAEKVGAVTNVMEQTGTDVKIDTRVTGYNIPVLVNNKTSRVAISLASIIFKSTEGLEWKSCLVYLLPIFGILSGVLAVIGLGSVIAIFPMVIISGLISGFGLYNLKNVAISNEMVNVTIEKGLWDTMYAFLFIAGVGIIWLVVHFAFKAFKKG